jgi:hypothetical protein
MEAREATDPLPFRKLIGSRPAGGTVSVTTGFASSVTSYSVTSDALADLVIFLELCHAMATTDSSPFTRSEHWGPFALGQRVGAGE